MPGQYLRVLVLLTGVTSLAGSATTTPTLTFEDRVRAQEAIERIYYSHQIGATLPFDEAISGALLEKKVRRYLQLSAALERFWTTPVTAAMLQREATRIASNTRMPERLREVYGALDNDPFVIQECFIRPALVERLARSFFQGDDRIHAEANLATGRIPKIDMAEWLESMKERLPIDDVATVADASSSLPQPSLAATCDPAGLWDNGILDDSPPSPSVRSQHSVVWTGSEMIVWGGFDGSSYLSIGDRYDPVTNAWRSVSLTNAPSPRDRHSAIWTGTEMIVWGGNSSSYSGTNTGGRYNPATDTWQPTSITNAPDARTQHTAVWTGSEMVVWGCGGGSIYDTGGRYNPATDTWRPTSLLNAPSGRCGHTAVWTGSRMIVWGGYNNIEHELATGARYDPAADSWSATKMAGAPTARQSHTAVWTGTEMIVWGGTGFLDTGGRYNPTTDLWAATSTTGAPQGREGHTAVWTGTAMIVWGGFAGFSSRETATGGRYTPATNSWAATSNAGAPWSRMFHTAVWTGSQMIVWGGGDAGSGNELDSGGRYDPVSDSWTPTLKTRFDFGPGVWTGNELMIWDGSVGWRYSPLTDAWTSISTVTQPSLRNTHSVIWSGTEMIVWGGGDNARSLATGGRYNPSSDNWLATSTTNAPEPRGEQTAIWTGLEMIVWGGSDSYSGLHLKGSGGRYNPSTDTWSSVSMTGAASPRLYQTAVWTGTEMIIWGGVDFADPNDPQGDGELATGGRYNPATDTWRPTSMTNAPSPRQLHSAVWTGSEMIVFGGFHNTNSVFYNTGGRYNPATNTWTATPTGGAPVTAAHAAIWTGAEMFVACGTPAAAVRYDPAAGTWVAMASAGRPPSSIATTAVWTGDAMIVWLGSVLGGGRYIPPSAATDADADGVRVCDGDCDDGNASVWAKPGETTDLNLSGGSGEATLSWNAPPSLGGFSVLYDAIRAPGPSGFAGAAAVCVATDEGPGTSTTDADEPPAGGIFYYLVRAQNNCPAGQGTLGSGTSGAPRSGRSCP